MGDNVNVGDKIKQLRTERNLTQPQLAQAIGIEQSYLSKLENDKSVPSADIFQAILRAFAIDVGKFLDGIDERIVHRHLRQIPEVANHLGVNTALRVHNIKRWLYGSAVAGVLGLTIFVAGYRGFIFPGKQYNYFSPGVVLPGESSDVFRFIEMEQVKRAGEYAARLREHHLLSSDYRGMGFAAEVPGGTRYYAFRGESDTQRSENRFLMLFGTLLAIGGLFGFIVEHRLRGITESRPRMT